MRKMQNVLLISAFSIGIPANESSMMIGAAGRGIDAGSSDSEDQPLQRQEEFVFRGSS